jgi:succinyl-CoA synthetase beta subunit
MKLYEHQARKLLAAYGIPVPEGDVATTPQEAAKIAQDLNSAVVVKAQVQIGGRGKAGGVKLADNPEEAEKHAQNILGMDIKGYTVNEILVAKAVDIASEYYVSILIERESKAPMFITCREGGVDIEEVANKSPEKIKKWTVDPRYKLMSFQGRLMGYHLNEKIEVTRQIGKVMAGMYRLMESEDTSLVEINPLILTPTGEVWAIDAKITIDDSSLYRHKELRELWEKEDLPVTERMARDQDLSYVKLDGDVGCVVNGAGLAMATMDLIKYHGGEPANFLDIGGSSNPEKVVTALEIISHDSNVKCILLNIFGGITRCDDVAMGVKEFLASREIKVPTVIRLTGTNEKEGIEILKDLGLSATNSMDEAVKNAVEVASNN